MSSRFKISLIEMLAIGVVTTVIMLGCCKTPNAPQDTKHLAEFHNLTTNSAEEHPLSNELALFVDYSNCISDGMHSSFYQKLVSPLTAATKEYWSIKGDTIKREVGDVYYLLNNVKEVHYAALDNAIDQMADRNTESVMLTDGELFTMTATKDNPNNPYMHAAFKKWLLKGHDIHIIAEPYKETYKGNVFNKKRIYIIFTDDRIKGNIYDRIKETVNFQGFPDVDEFHLSGNYSEDVPSEGKKNSQPNDVVAATITPGNSMEIQDWAVDWNTIQTLMGCEYDNEGNPLPIGLKLIGGLGINRNSFGCYRITDVDVKVSNINSEYFDIYNQLELGQKVGKKPYEFIPIENFIIIDKDEFKKHGNVDLYFDITHFNPSGDLDGCPYNYFKIDIVIKDIENIMGNSLDMFKFDSLSQPGKTNESIAESLKQCVFDQDLVNQLKGKVLYTIYVKSDKYN